ncbi:MAG: hypothetical protein HUU04_04185 [Verrucomicrobiae bacterium]|nr:hypothetical protein [Verrucomicrobiae bacterium]
MRIAGPCLLLFALAVMRAEARLGETQAEIEKRYGPAIRKVKFQKPVERRFKYHFSGYIIEVSFIQDRCVMEAIERADRGFLGEDEVAAFLRANEAGSSWRREENSNTERGYRRADGKAIAHLDAYLTRFTVMSADSGTPSEEVDGKRVRKRLEGF